MKYVMFQVELGELHMFIPIIFPNALTHKSVQRSTFGNVREAYPNATVTIRSAGFYNLGGMVFGESETLSLKSHADDSAIINRHDYLHGIVFPGDI